MAMGLFAYRSSVARAQPTRFFSLFRTRLANVRLLGFRPVDYFANSYHNNYHKHWPEAIVVYMQGLNTPGALTDPDGKRPGWQKTFGDQGDRDLKFFDAVLATLRKP